MVLLTVLRENGGVALLNPDLLFTEGLEWINQVHASPYVNLGNVDISTEFVGFFTPKLGKFDLYNVNTTGDKLTEPYKPIHIRPAILRDLIASVPNGKFIT